MAALGVAREEGLVSPSYAVYRPYGTALEAKLYAEVLVVRSAPFKSDQYILSFYRDSSITAQALIQKTS